MIASINMMQPLPVRPVDGGTSGTDMRAPRTTTRLMQPLPMPDRESGDLVGAVRDAAYQRMLQRLDIKHPLPVDDPAA